MQNNFIRHVLVLLIVVLLPCAAVASPEIVIGSVDILDEGDDTKSLMSVDVARAVCDEETETLERFHETILRLGVYNNGDENITLSRYRITVPNAFGEGVRYRSRRFSTHQTIVPGDTTQTVDLLFLTTNEAAKVYLGNSRAIPSTNGPRRVTIEIWGSSHKATVRQTVNFTNLDRCTE